MKDNRVPCARCEFLIHKDVDYYREIQDLIFCEFCVEEYVKSIDESSIIDETIEETP